MTFRRLLAHSGVQAGASGNVTGRDDTSLVKVVTLIKPEEHLASTPFVEPVQSGQAIKEWIPPKNFAFVENIVAYISGFVVRKIMVNIDCGLSKASLISSPSDIRHEQMYHLLELKDNGGLVIPSQGIVDMLLSAKKAIRREMNIHSAKQIPPQSKIVCIVKAEFGAADPLKLGQHIIESQDGIDNHYLDILEMMVKTFYNIRQNHVAKLHSSRLKDFSVRQKLTKLVLFKGQ